MIMSSDGQLSCRVISLAIIAGRITGIDINTGIIILASSPIISCNIIVEMSASTHHIRVIFIIEMLNALKIHTIAGFIQINIRCANHGCIHDSMNRC